MEKVEDVAAEVVEKVEKVSDETREESTKKKATTGLYFSNIPKDVRVSEFKNVLRDRHVKLVFVKWKAFKQSAIVFFEDELDVVMKNLDGLTLQEEAIKYEEVLAKPEGREASRRPPKGRKDREEREGREGGRRRREDRDSEVEKTRKRTNRKEQRIKKREDYGSKFGIFVGKIPKGVTREDLGQEFAKLQVPLPDYVDWVVKKGHAFAFWQEAHKSLSLELFTGITVGGVTLQVELYDTNRVKMKEERRKEENEAENGDAAAPAKAEEKKSTRKHSTKSESEKKATKNDDNESHSELNGAKPEDAKKPAAAASEEEAKRKPTTPKKTVSSKANDEKSPAKPAAVKKSPVKAPETPTKPKSPKGQAGDTKSPAKTQGETKSPAKTQGEAKSPSKKSGTAETAEAGKENCSIS